jgi:hypothetical protein
MPIKISDMTPDAAVGGAEKIPVSDDGTPKSVTIDQIKAFTIDGIEAIAPGAAVTVADKVFILQGGVLKPVSLSVIAQHAIDAVWAKTPETVADGADVLALKDGGTVEKTLTLAILAEYVRGAIEAAVLDVSDLAAVSSLASEDVLLVTQGTTGKKASFSVVSEAVYAALADHVAGKAAVSAPADSDVFYVIQGGVAKKVALSSLKAVMGSTVAPTATTEDKIPQWDSSPKTLKDGLSLRTAVRAGATADDASIPTEKAVRDLEKGIINAQADIGAALEGIDTLLVDDGAAGTQKKTAVYRLWDYVLSRIQGLAAKATPVAADILVIQDSADSDALKEMTLASLKTHLETAGTYDHIWISARNMTPSVTAGATALASVEYPTNDMTHSVLVFPGITSDKSAEFNIVMPPSWDRGAIKFKAFWAPGHTDANPDEFISLSLAAGAFSNDDGLDSTLGTPQIISDQATSDDDMHVSAASAAITVAGSPALGDVIHFKLTRDFDYAGAGAAMDVDLRLFGVLIQYQKTNAVAAW